MTYTIEREDGGIEVIPETGFIPHDVKMDYEKAEKVIVRTHTKGTLGLRGSEISYFVDIGDQKKQTFHNRLMFNNARVPGIFMYNAVVGEAYLNGAEVGVLFLGKTHLDSLIVDEETLLKGIFMHESSIKNVEGSLPEGTKAIMHGRNSIPKKLEEILQK